jgi:hypothetical protein
MDRNRRSRMEGFLKAVTENPHGIDNAESRTVTSRVPEKFKIMHIINCTNTNTGTQVLKDSIFKATSFRGLFSFIIWFCKHNYVHRYKMHYNFTTRFGLLTIIRH